MQDKLAKTWCYKDESGYVVRLKTTKEDLTPTIKVDFKTEANISDVEE